jgi:hypothetical protein
MSEIGQIRVLVAKEGDYWVAQCLEYDIGAQARDLDQLRNRLIATIEDEFEESMHRRGKLFDGIDPAPQYFHELWTKRAKSFGPSQPTVVKNQQEINIEFGLAG